jgi:cytochrome c
MASSAGLRRACICAAALFLPLATVHAEGDAARGQRVFQRCYSCHSVNPEEQNLQGPNLAGVVGRRAGTLPQFEYSEAMIAAGRNGLVWTEENLNTYVTDPQKMVPGTAMGPVRISNPADRADLIAYLKSAKR